jgi:hypothetical protein
MKTASIAFALVLTGCSLDYEPDVGPPHAVAQDPTAPDGGRSGCDNADSDPNVTTSFSADVRPLLTRSPGGCGCHLGRTTSGLDVSSYDAMRRGGLYSGVSIVVAGDPCNSILVQKVGRTPPFGSRMPFNGPPYYTSDEVQVFHDWIAEGAANN